MLGLGILEVRGAGGFRVWGGVVASSSGRGGLLRVLGFGEFGISGYGFRIWGFRVGARGPLFI